MHETPVCRCANLVALSERSEYQVGMGNPQGSLPMVDQLLVSILWYLFIQSRRLAGI